MPANNLRTDPCPVRLEPGLQLYAWGDTEFIPQLLGVPNPDRRPHAELWLGSHPSLPAKAEIDGDLVSLDELLERNGEWLIGAQVERRFGGFPYLLKVLAAAQPLSIQVHPTRSQAEEGFLRENSFGIPLSAAERNYKDKNHKPELIVAVSDFFLLSGFRLYEEIASVVADTPELGEVAAEFRPTDDGMKALFERLMRLPQDRVDVLLTSLLERIRRQNDERPFPVDDPYGWLLRADDLFARDGHRDPGLFAFLFLNLVHLAPGQALFSDAGTLHAYLEGVGIEVMASSDNVLRCGLTSKHIDVPELLRIVRFTGERPRVLEASRVADGPECVYRTSASEFELSCIELAAGQSYKNAPAYGGSILLVLDLAAGGVVRVASGRGALELGRGGACLIPHGGKAVVEATGKTTIFKATVPATAGSVHVSNSDVGNTTEEGDLSFRGLRPPELRFGTSGLRGLVIDITDLEAYVNTRGFLEYLLDGGELAPGGSVAIAGDLRPSTDRILRAVARSIADIGLDVVHLGKIPTPALTHYAMQKGWPSVMGTGSHIPFDRNGIKFNKRNGEVLKDDEAGILSRVARVRRHEYTRNAVESIFGDDGMFKPGSARPLPPPIDDARQAYICRYLDFFNSESLKGKRLVSYEHSAVGRDVLAEILEGLGAEVVRMGRSDEFVPLDTESITEQQFRLLQNLADEARSAYGPIDAIVSTDGDSDRPLLLGNDDKGEVRFFSGDLLGILVADLLQADDIAVPVSASDAVELYFKDRGVTVTRTKIGSPYVIAAMHVGHGARRVGWEANGGFLTGSDIERNGRVLTSLPTRDAALPLLAVLAGAAETGRTILELLECLPTRWSKAGLIDDFSLETSRALLGWLSPADERVGEAVFADGRVTVSYKDGHSPDAPENLAPGLRSVRGELQDHFTAARGFGEIVRLNFLDGIRVHFANGDIAHIRPSGNAPQLRCYAIADTEARAEEIVALAIREPDGMLRELESRWNDVELVEAIRANVELTKRLLNEGHVPEVIGTVSGSTVAQAFWQHHLDLARESFRSRVAMSFHEDLPVNQAFGVLLLWQRLRDHLRQGEGALVAFVFGEGTRASPFTETENGQKPAIATFASEPSSTGPRHMPMVELAMRCFVPVEQYLRRSGFEGLVIKWGDEIQIPTLDLSARDPLFEGADVVRFVSGRAMNEDEAQNKDWVGVDADGQVTAFIPRRPLEGMERLAERGLLQRRAGELWGGVNLGSIAISYVFLDALLEEFSAEVNDPSADRKSRPDLDPQFFTALTIATIDDEAGRESAWRTAIEESEAIRRLAHDAPAILERLRRVVERFGNAHSRRPKIVAMDLGSPYWGDIGQHAKIHDFFMALNDRGPLGEIARAIADIPGGRDGNGNILVGETVVSRDVTVRDSVLINAQLLGKGLVERSVLVGTRAGTIQAREAFDVLSVVSEIHLEPRSGTYKVISEDGCRLGSGERRTTLFAFGAPAHLRVEEGTDLRDRTGTYDVSILENPMSFRDAHEAMSRLSPAEVSRRREGLAREVWDRVKDTYREDRLPSP